MTAPADDRLRRQCIALSGALAEAGVQRVTLTTPDRVARTLLTRQTDLPATLAASAPGTAFDAHAIGLRIVHREGWLEAEGDGDPGAMAIIAALRRL